MRELKFSDRDKSVAARRQGKSVAARSFVAAVCVACCALVMLAAVGVGYAQAGRRVAKPKSDPPVPKSAEATAAPVAEPTAEPEKISLLVTGYTSGSMRYALGLADNLPGVVGRRLQDSRRLQITSGGEMTRGEATKRAKNAETKTFVVWVELEGHGFDLDPINQRTRVEDLSVHYIVLEPGTAKLKDQGSVPLRPVRGGVLGTTRRLPSCYPQVTSSFEYAVVYAGIETAERVFRTFSLTSPALCT
ncbi:MAG: hypothetical protein QOG00_979 [Pyrinomonadaceae bacterium]|nr:hypothetical protein [Pyrinomonadaceae bacterium]